MTHESTTRYKVILVLILAVLLPGTLEAASDVATFESFYRESWSVSPWTWVLAAVAAIVTVVAIIYFAPAAGPVVSTVGTWIGGMFGFSGIAATNFGLALLGGGSIAAGGFGVVGGTAVLSAAFAFGTDIVIDYGTGKVVEKYRYDKFVEASQEMMTLPLPRNSRGPDAYKEAMAILQNVSASEPLSSSSNQALVKAAIGRLRSSDNGELSPLEIARVESMLGLLHFVAGEYKQAGERAHIAVRLAGEANAESTLPAFLIATSHLYDEKVDFDTVAKLFRYSVRNEVENPLTPLLFAIMLDRMNYRLNEGSLSTTHLAAIVETAELPSLADRRPPIYVILLSRYLVRLKLEQQKISSLAQSSNQTVRQSASSLAAVKRSLREYDLLLEGANRLAGALASFGTLSQADAPAELREVEVLLKAYSNDRVRLQRLVTELEKYQGVLATKKAAAAKPASGTREHLRSLLDQAQLIYEMDGGDRIGLTYAIDEERSQAVWVSAESDELGASKYWQIFSFAAGSKEPLSADIMSELLRENAEFVAGGWYVTKEEDEFVLGFAVPVPVSVTSEQLSELIELAMLVADEKEQELTGADEW